MKKTTRKEKRQVILEVNDSDDDLFVLNNQDGEPVVNIVIPEITENQTISKGDNAPLFIKKLWAMVQDKNNADIIGWNENGDGFIIHNQTSFFTKTLPRYFKHNNLASFVRQLNLYDFHKTQNIDKNEFQFSHPFFLKSVPQLMDLIKRKSSRPNQPKPAPKVSSEFDEIMKVCQEIKSKNESITEDIAKIREENSALWGEVNNLRVKYSKQSKIVNKLIHFLITYIQKHHNARKSGRAEEDTEDSIKAGPKIMELDYRYKNNPHEFWTDFDKEVAEKPATPEAYTVVEPGDECIELNQQQNIKSNPSDEEPLNNDLQFDQNMFPIDDDSNHQPLPSSSLPNINDKSALQRAGSSKENVNYVPDNSQFDFNTTIKELLQSLPPDEWTTFCKLYSENNASNPNDEMSLDICLDGNDELMPDSELRSLSDSMLSTRDVLLTPNFHRDEPMDFGILDPVNTNPNKENISQMQNEENSFNPDDILFGDSVDEYINME